jgi:hypothetical protein
VPDDNGGIVNFNPNGSVQNCMFGLVILYSNSITFLHHNEFFFHLSSQYVFIQGSSYPNCTYNLLQQITGKNLEKSFVMNYLN